MSFGGLDPAFVVEGLTALIIAGVLGGLIAGMLGVGGGIVIVPVLYTLLTGFDVEEGLRMKIAVATSLATIIATSSMSIRSHHRRGAVDVSMLKSWGVPIFVGVVAGTLLGGYVDGRILTAVFMTVAILVALKMVFDRTGVRLRDDFPNGVVKATSGMLVGGVSAMMGIGGGTLSVPILTAYGFDMRRAVGTAAAIGFIIAIPGTLGYALTGIGVADRPPYSLGYVSLPALIALTPLTMATAPLGARIAHTVERRTLQLWFAAFLAITALKMGYDLLRSL